MNLKYEQTIYLFKEINPSKMFSGLEFSELEFNEVNVGDCKKDEVLMIDGVFYIYSGETENHWNEKKKSIIRFKKRKQIVKEISI